MSVHRGAQLVVVHAGRKTTPTLGRTGTGRSPGGSASTCRKHCTSSKGRVQQSDTASDSAARTVRILISSCLLSHEPVGLARFRFRSIADRVCKWSNGLCFIPAATTHVQSTFRVSSARLTFFTINGTSRIVSASFDSGHSEPSLRRAGHSELQLMSMMNPAHCIERKQISSWLALLEGRSASAIPWHYPRSGSFRRSPRSVLVAARCARQARLDTLDEAVLGWPT